jgi:hypothetical protein
LDKLTVIESKLRQKSQIKRDKHTEWLKQNPVKNVKVPETEDKKPKPKKTQTIHNKKLMAEN